MKRLIVTLALVALMSGNVLAEGTTFGFMGGLNLANVTGDDVEDNETKLCFGGGVFVNFPMNEVISMQPELLFMMKGTKLVAFDDAGVRMSYIDIPVLAKFTVPMEGAFAPCFFVGPYVGFNTSAESYVEDEEFDVKDQIKSTDYGLVFGGGFDYAMGEGNLIFNARYALGLTTIDDTDADDDVKNTGIIFMVGYGFNLWSNIKLPTLP